jgi:hypothetical protein
MPREAGIERKTGQWLSVQDAHRTGNEDRLKDPHSYKSGNSISRHFDSH